MGHNNLVGSYSGSGKVTQVDKYGNVTCETVCVVLKVSKTCSKDNVYLINVIVGDNVYNSLIVKSFPGFENWLGVGEGVTQFLQFFNDEHDDHYDPHDNHCDSTDGIIKSVNYNFSSYVSGNHEMWKAGNFTLKPCKCYKKDKCGCDCERH